MAKETLTLALEGDVALGEFASAISSFNSLLNELSKEVGQEAKVDWLIEELYASSAVATFRGVNKDIAVVEDIVNAYEKVGDSLQSGREIPYSANVKKHANNLANIINGRITAIRMETPTCDFVITGKITDGEKGSLIKYALGSVKGTVQTLSMRKGLNFTLWDNLFDRPVSCYFKEGEEENMRSVWGKRAIVSGRVGRRSDTGRPIVVREVKYVRVQEMVEPGSYKRAKGVLPWVQGNELPEDIIRRLRSA